MLLNKLAIRTATAFAANGSYNTASQRLMNASVMLLSGGADYFVGSAVILGAGKEVTFTSGKWKTSTKQFTVIVSALHNLYINSDKTNKIPPLAGNAVTWSQKYATDFASQVKIRYGTGALAWNSNPTGSAAIDYVVPIFKANLNAAGKILKIGSDASEDGNAFQLLNLKGATRADGTAGGGPADAGLTPAAGSEVNSWSYDVMLLISKDAGLYTYATTGNCGYMGAKTLQSVGENLLPADNPRLKVTVPVLGRQYRLFQLGYGKTSDPDVKVKVGVGKTKRPSADPPDSPGAVAVTAPTFQKLQYKRALPKAAAVTEFFQNTEYKLPNGTDLVLRHEGGILLDCRDGNNSTFSGDSGGPVAVFPVGGAAESYLIGVNTGAGAATSDGDARANKVWEYDNNVVTSLGYFCENLYDLRFQNV